MLCMELVKALKLFCIAFPILILIDVLWLGVIATSIYQSQIGRLMRTADGQAEINIPAGLIVWALIVLGAIFFVLPHAKNQQYFGQFGWGALFGLVVYGVYDFTNLSILAGWPLSISLIDLAWGVFLNGTLSVILVRLNRFF